MDDDILSELQSLKKLTILLLAKLGASSEEIGIALGMHPGSVRKIIPLRKIKRIKLPDE